MIRIDYTQLDQPTIVLSLAKAPGGYIVWDQHCRYYVLSPSPLLFCLRFMKAMADKGDAVIDDASVERITWEAAQHSVRADVLEEGGDGSSIVGRLTAPPPSSNVLPFRKATG